MTKETLTFCITHMDPAVPPRFFDHAITLGDYGMHLPTHVSRLDTFWHLARPVAYSSAGNYTIPKAVAMLGTSPQQIGVISQRKLMSRPLIGRSAAAYPTLREVSSGEVSGLETEQTRPLPEHDFLVTTPLFFPDGVVAQYATAHIAVDLFDYLSLSVEMNVLSQADLKIFALQKHFIPGGCELGYYPANWLLPTLNSLEALGRTYLLKYERRIRSYNNHQVRALSFLSERIGSYLLIKKLIEVYGPRLNNAVFAHMCVLIDGGNYTHGISIEQA